MIHVAVGIIIDQEKKILVALRPAHKHQGGLWEFPGGKVEAGEEPLQALKRELREEVGIEISQAKPLMQCSYDYKEHAVWLDVWEVLEFTGEAHGREGQPIAWVSKEELRDLPMLSANHPIVEKLRNTRQRQTTR